MIPRTLAKKMFKMGFSRPSFPKDFQPFGRPLTNLERINVITLTELSEIIEACGKDFGGLIQVEDEKGFHFEAFDSTNSLPYIKLTSYHGPSAEKATAKLWIAINSK